MVGLSSRRGAVGLLLLVLLALLGPPVTAEQAGAATLVTVNGAGSTWSRTAIDEWRRVGGPAGPNVAYQGTGSTDGRNQFRNGTVEFAVTETPYGVTDNGIADPPPARGFAYMPIVAGGTAIVYNLKTDGRRITNLRLGGENLAKIFTGVITRWDDAALKADNPGLVLPNRPVVPVVRSDGSGSTALLTEWLAAQYPDLWNTYCGRMGRATPCGQTSNFPFRSPFLGLAGSAGVAGYVSQEVNEGAITYVAASYAAGARFPIAKLLNKANYYVAPTAPNVAVALGGAQTDTDLTQRLGGVYNNPDKRAYPLSSYSYMVVPTTLDAPMTEDKGYTLSRFATYVLCQGQQITPELGYAPLPMNLVQAGLDVVKRIPGHDPATVDIAACRNPTFSPDGGDLLARTAPMPPECDRLGAPVDCLDPAATPTVTPAEPLTITTTDVGGARSNEVYAATLVGAGGVAPYTWTLRTGSLPPGLTLLPGGLIAGTPGVAGVYPLLVEVRDAVGTVATRALSVTVTDALLAIVTTGLPPAAFLRPYATNLATTGGTGPFAWSVSAGPLPPGLTLSPTGTLSGSASRDGTWTFGLRVTDAKGASATQVLTLVTTVAMDVVTSAVSAASLAYSYRAGCPVTPAALRRVELNEWGFDGRAYRGSLIVRATAVDAVTRVFGKAFDARFPVKSMNPVELYKGSDIRSMAADNSSVFNCRHVTGNPTRFSQHSYGDAVDVNPFENPYVTPSQVYPAGSKGFLKRNPYRRGMMLRGGTLARAFAAEGWYWGARWAHPDYQHFSRNGR